VESQNLPSFLVPPGWVVSPIFVPRIIIEGEGDLLGVGFVECQGPSLASWGEGVKLM